MSIWDSQHSYVKDRLIDIGLEKNGSIIYHIDWEVIRVILRSRRASLVIFLATAIIIP